MTTRNTVLLISLWLSVIAMSTWVGGTLYQMSVIVPLWSASPPESVRAFFLGTNWNRTVFSFFGPPFILARNVPIVIALVAGWHSPPHRRAILLTTACFTVFGALFTVFYVYPINDVLFAAAGGSRNPDEIRALVATWIFRDRLRFGVGLVGFTALLHAFRLPMPGGREAGSRAA
jgi:hypothetical protein